MCNVSKCQQSKATSKVLLFSCNFFLSYLMRIMKYTVGHRN